MGTSLRIVQQFFPKVKKVNDATQDVTVTVIPRDNEHAKVRDHSACAFAVACKRMFKPDGVIVAVKTAYLIKGDTATRYHLPESISREVVTFDRNGVFDEGEYHLHRPPKSGRLGARPSDGRKERGKGEAPQFKSHKTNGIRVALGSKNAPDGIQRTHA